MKSTIKLSAKKTTTRGKLTLRSILGSIKARKTKSLASFYGKLPDAFGNAVDYQKSVRNEWK